MKKLFITVLVLATVICGVALNTVFYAPYGYVKECYYSESELFEKITVCLKELYKPEMSCIEYISNTGEYAERIGDTYIIKTKEAGNLYRLIEHYLQKVREHHNSTGFNYFKAYYDNDGDMVWYTAAKTDKIENNNGINEPDEVDYLLVYIDEECEDSVFTKVHISRNNAKQIIGNWYIWSKHSYSG